MQDDSDINGNLTVIYGALYFEGVMTSSNIRLQGVVIVRFTTRECLEYHEKK